MPLARAIFDPRDDKILHYLEEEGHQIEPTWYIPVIPFVLVNGIEGIGTGYSTTIPSYNPRDIIENCRRFIRKEPLQPMVPWFRNFRGSVIKKGSGGFITEGVCSASLGSNTIEITELPIRKWTQTYKEYLEQMIE